MPLHIILELTGCFLWVLTQINWEKVKSPHSRSALNSLLNDIKAKRRFRSYFRSLGFRKLLIGNYCFTLGNMLLQYIESNEFSARYPEFLEENRSKFALCSQYQSFRHSNSVVPEFSSFVASAKNDFDSQLILIAKNQVDCMKILLDCCNGQPELDPIAMKIDNFLDRKKPVFEKNNVSGGRV